MVFSSLVFLSLFLPAALIGCRLLPSVKAQNALLLGMSLVFYAYGEPVYVLLMIASAAGNYLWALLISRFRSGKKGILALAVIQNLSVLGIFKYAGFLAETWNTLTGLSVPVPQISLPIGISFFTFQAMSYVFDVYREETAAQKNYFRLLLYISFFPQLIAGPIVKYHDIDRELADRSMTADGMAEGIRRFIAGLSKKVLIANTMGAVADTLYAAPLAQINAPAAWMAAVSYMLQIYFDFSGYSDMAIGMGRMFGFHFRENFNYPYIADSVQEFWRRWHISLSTWFREYLYIPLGGNRKGRARTVLNKLIVFACTGIWHGANLTFLFWGLYHGFFLMLEEVLPVFRKKGNRAVRLARHVYLLLVVMIGFVFFRSDTIRQGFVMTGKLFTGWQFPAASMRLCLSMLTPLNLAAFAAALAASTPCLANLKGKAGWERLSWIVTPALLLLCMLCLAGGTYNPFIYFRF